MSAPEPFSPEEAFELRRMLGRALESAEKLTAATTDLTAMVIELQRQRDELLAALRDALVAVDGWIKNAEDEGTPPRLLVLERTEADKWRALIASMTAPKETP